MKKAKYIVKKGYAIKFDGHEYKEGDEIELTKEEAKPLHVESADEYKARQVLEGKDHYDDTKTPVTDDLIAKIEKAQSVETIEVLMSLSTVKSVATAGKKRLKELKDQAVALFKARADALLAKVPMATDKKALSAIEGEAAESLDPEGYDTVAKAIDDRKKALKV